MLLEQRDRCIGSFEKLQAGIAAQGQLAFKAFGGDVLGVPGGRSFGELSIGLGVSFVFI
jgi:hypothetical protein